MAVAAPSLATMGTVVNVHRWRTYQHPTDGYTFRAPPDSGVAYPWGHPDQHPRAMSIFPGYTTAARAGVPANKLKLVIGPFEGPPPVGEPFAVGDGRYPGMIAAPTRDATTGTYSVVIIYEAAGETWQIVGTFAEPPDRANPNAEVFYDIVASVRHGP